MDAQEDVQPNFKIVNVKSEAGLKTDGENSQKSPLPERGTESLTPTIVIKQDESPDNRVSSRQGFIEVNGSSGGMNNFTLKSGASVSKCPSQLTKMQSLVQQMQNAHAQKQKPCNNDIGSSKSSIPSSADPIKKSNDLDMTNTAPIIKNLENMLRAGNQVFHIQVKVPGADKDSPHKNIQQVIVVNPGEDADKAMSQAVGEITKRLNNEAAEKLAHGISPEKETIIEITRIANPSESYFSKESVQKIKSKDNIMKPDSHRPGPTIVSSNLMRQAMNENPSRTYHRRKSPPRGRIIRTVSPQPQNLPMLHKAPTIISSQELFKDRYRNSSVTEAPSSRSTTTAPHKSPATDMTAAMKLGISAGLHVQNRTTMIPSTNPRNLTMIFSDPPNSDNPVTTIVHPPNTRIPLPPPPAPPPPAPKRTIAILNRSRSSSHHTYIIQPAQSTSKTHTVTLNDNCSPLESPEAGSLDLEDITSEDGSVMNDSLTNIQWLGHMKGDTLQVVNHKDIRLIASEKQIEKVNQECGKNKRPPYSYMHLIQMAICSTPDRRMTLKDIYTWIELKFPYYRYNPNKGWRNSIRHNLSLYDIFVREKVCGDGKAATSLWTLRSDFKAGSADDTCSTVDEFNDSLFACDSPSSESPVMYVPSTPSSDTSRSLATPTPPPPSAIIEKKAATKKRPVPLLPKPVVSQPQTYALIPIQGGVPVVPPQPILVPANWTPNSRYPTFDLNNAKAMKRSASPSSSLGAPHRKQIRIAPKLPTPVYTNQPWQPANHYPQHLHQPRNNNTAFPNMNSYTQLPNLDSSDMHHQLSAMQYSDSGLGQSLSSSDLSGHDLSAFEVKFSKSTRALKQEKGQGKDSGGIRLVRKGSETDSAIMDSDENMAILNDSNLSESGINDILASIEKDLDSPAKQLLKTPTKGINGSLFTSTPVKHGLDSPSWISPIRSVPSHEMGGHLGSHIISLSPSNSSLAGKKTSTPLEGDHTHIYDVMATPENKHNSLSALYRSSFKSTCKVSPKGSPKLGSLRSFGLVGLTPMKSPAFARSIGQSPALSLEEGNQSFGRLLGDLHLDSMIEEGINLDVSNISFSHIKCD